MSLENPNALIDHLDSRFAGGTGASSQENSSEMQRLMKEDETTAREWQYLNMAVDALQDAGLREQVATVRKELEEQAPEEGKSGVVRNLYRNMMRVAAAAILIAGGACIFKYVRLSSSSLYSEYYMDYQLNNSRGAGTPDTMEQAYTDKNWPGVLELYTAGKGKNNKTEFLTGMADLELKKYDDAIAHFEQVIASNSSARQDYFEDEAEYYLALSWLAKNKVNEAMPILEKIRANKDHLYHDRVVKMSFTDLRLVQYKENK